MTNDHLLMNIILPRFHRAPLATDLPNRETATDEASWTQQQPEGGDQADHEDEDDLDVDDVNSQVPTTHSQEMGRGTNAPKRWE